ncbi:solute carrier family 39 (zinc transporter), member 1/2/3 [Nematocida sp. LUAm3]|nr:solute carrier family 39 (zinc transporter), member 1/2/3 [Nematocida sp. LUAm3]KAI5178709.1 solute carrier family 39 (zinc transporter), member 1/2/3 [Nematocida sp. LUAm1]
MLTALESVYYMPTVIFVCSIIPSLFPSLLLSSSRLRKAYNKANVISAGVLLAILFMDFIPHMASGGCNHGHAIVSPKNISADSKDVNTSHTHSAHGPNCSHGHNHSHHQKATETHSHDHHSHECTSTHEHTHMHGGANSNAISFGLAVAGVSLIVLILLDQKVIKHKHCDKAEEVELQGGAPSVRIEETVHLSESASSSHHGHSHSEKKSKDDMHLCCTEGLKYKTTAKQALVFILVFSIHSIFEGMAFRPDVKRDNVLFIGLIIHKILESITVGVSLFSSSFSFKVCSGLLLFYSSLTPLGMILSMSISSAVSSPFVQTGFMGLAFGSLCFIVLIEMLPPLVHSLGSIWTVLYLISGYLIGAGLIAFYK